MSILAGKASVDQVAAYSGHREHPDRSIVNAKIQRNLARRTATATLGAAKALDQFDWT